MFFYYHHYCTIVILIINAIKSLLIIFLLLLLLLLLLLSRAISVRVLAPLGEGSPVFVYVLLGKYVLSSIVLW